MTDGPPLWGRMLARLQGEVPTTTLEAYRRASLPVFELLERAEGHRLAGATDGLTPWTLPHAARTASLCAWNAFVLQVLGNDILDADYEVSPATAGFVPPVTADQVMAWFTQVEAWVDRAQQAHANPAYRLDVRVPAALPLWRDAHPCPPAHLRGMLRALHTIGEHAAAGLAALEGAAAQGAEQQAQADHIRQLYASAQSKARYAEELHTADAPLDVQVRVERYARDAIERFFTLGQLIADPTLLSRPGQAAHGATPLAGARNPSASHAGEWMPPRSGLPRPGDPAFDIWCLTDPRARAALHTDPQAVGGLGRLWAMDPDPAATLRLQAGIQAACERGDVAHAVDQNGKDVGYWHRCPWGVVYVANRAVEVGGQRLLKGERFVLGVGLDRDGKEFRRRLIVSSFTGRARVSYGDG